MMTTVCVLSILGKKARPYFRRFSSPGHLHTPKNRRKVKLWRKYGMWGVAFLTPLVLSPIGGTLVAVSFGEKISRIIYTMLIAGFLWAIVFSVTIYTLGEEILRFLGR
jgi:small neutral amino acid transporter SnatA (MarC family)